VFCATPCRAPSGSMVFQPFLFVFSPSHGPSLAYGSGVHAEEKVEEESVHHNHADYDECRDPSAIPFHACTVYKHGTGRGNARTREVSAGVAPGGRRSGPITIELVDGDHHQGVLEGGDVVDPGSSTSGISSLHHHVHPRLRRQSFLRRH